MIEPLTAPQQRPRWPGRIPAGIWLMVLGLLLVAAMPYFEGFSNANERPRLLQAMARVERGTWAIDGPAAGGIEPGIDTARGADGQLYPNKPPGATIPAMLAWVGVDALSEADLRQYTQWARVLGGLVPTLVILGWALFRYTGPLGRAPAVAGVVLYGLATPAASYARLLFGHQLAAALVLLGTGLLLDAHRYRRVPAAIRAGAGGFLAGAAVTVEYLAVFAALPLAGLLIAGLRRDGRVGAGRVAAAVAGSLVPVAWLAGYHERVFGTPWTTGYHRAAHAAFARIHEQGLLGLSLPRAEGVAEVLVSPWGGLLYWAPLVVLGGIGLLGVARRIPALRWEVRVHGALLVLFLLINLGLLQTGGWRVGPRYMVLVFPLAIPGLAWVCARAAEHRWMWAAWVAVVVWSVVINTLAASLFPHLIPRGNPLAELLLPLALDGVAPHGLVAAVTSPGPHVLAVVVGATVSTAGVALWNAGPRYVGAWGLGMLAGVGLLALAGGSEPTHDGVSDLQAVRRIWEPTPARPDPPSRSLEE